MVPAFLHAKNNPVYLEATMDGYRYEVAQMQINFRRLRQAVDAGLIQPHYQMTLSKWLDRIIFLKRMPDFGYSPQVLHTLQRQLLECYFTVHRHRLRLDAGQKV